RRPGLEPLAVGVAQHLPAVLDDEVGQGLGEDVRAARGHLGFGRRRGLERARAMEHMMGVDRGDRGQVGFAAGSDGAHFGQGRYNRGLPSVSLAGWPKRVSQRWWKTSGGFLRSLPTPPKDKSWS